MQSTAVGQATHGHSDKEVWCGPIEARLQERLESARLRRRKLSSLSQWTLREQRLWASAVECEWKPKARLEAAWVLREWAAELVKFGLCEDDSARLEAAVVDAASRTITAEAEVLQWGAVQLAQVLLGALLEPEGTESDVSDIEPDDVVPLWESLSNGQVEAGECVRLRAL